MPGHIGKRCLLWAFVFGVIAGNSAADPAMTVWNSAYQENYDPDTLAAIQAGARDAYVLLDPFDAPDAAAAQTAMLKARGNQVAAYISIGTGEDWRRDFEALRPALARQQWGEWDGEYFITTAGPVAVQVMKARIDLIADWGFDWVEFDNMDWAEDTGNVAEYALGVTQAQGMAYYQDLCRHARARGLKCMAKSTVEGAMQFDGVTYESYPDDMSWWDVAGAKRFAAAGKLVVIVHYDDMDCAGTYRHYRAIYGAGLSFLCEDRGLRGYVRF